MRRLFSFPNPVNDFAARTVATGVVALSVLFLITGWVWVLAVLAYGFWARVLTGPTLSPLGQIATRIVAPRISTPPKIMPGPPKRFAQGIGVVFSTTALVLALSVGLGSAQIVIAMLSVAAFLEAALGFCLGCKIFGLLMKLNVIPESVCEECADITLRYPTLTQTH
jgi:Domain of unknown function (DUF4395)